MTDEEIQNAVPVAELIDAYNRVGNAIESVIERDVRARLYKLKAGPRKEQVKLLADQGLSNRQIAKVLNVSPMTIGRDMDVTNVTPSVTNVTPESDLQDKLDDIVEKHKKRIKKIEDAHKKEVKELKEQITELQQGPMISNFASQTDAIRESLVEYIQHDNFVKMLSDLEVIKNEIVDEFDMLYLGHVIGGLTSLSKRALTWSERLTPTTNAWKNRTRR